MIGGGGGKSHLYLHFTSYLKLIFSYVTKEFTYEMERLTDIENRLWFKGKGMEEGGIGSWGLVDANYHI